MNAGDSTERQRMAYSIILRVCSMYMCRGRQCGGSIEGRSAERCIHTHAHTHKPYALETHSSLLYTIISIISSYVEYEYEYTTHSDWMSCVRVWGLCMLSAWPQPSIPLMQTQFIGIFTKQIQLEYVDIVCFCAQNAPLFENAIHTSINVFNCNGSNVPFTLYMLECIWRGEGGELAWGEGEGRFFRFSIHLKCHCVPSAFPLFHIFCSADFPHHNSQNAVDRTC